MDRRLFLPVVIMFMSVLLVSGMMNYQTGSASDAPEPDVSPQVLGEKEKVVQESPKASVEEPAEVKTNKSEVAAAPEPTPTMFYGGGGGLGSSAADDKDEEKDVTLETPKVSEEDTVIVKADFVYSADCLNVTFTDLSENASSLYWDFGDGSSSTKDDPVHEYAAAGSYTVVLTATGADEVTTDSAQAIVEVSEAYCVDETGDETGDENPVRTPVTQEVPEFPTIAIPMVAIIGMAFIFSRRQ